MVTPGTASGTKPAAVALDGKTQTMNNDEGETPLDEVLSKIYGDTSYHDVTLEGNDGVRLTANGTILTARSSFFNKMLRGHFQEAAKNKDSSTDTVVVRIDDFEGSILHAVVHYLHTGNTGIGDPPNDDTEDIEDIYDSEQILTAYCKFKSTVAEQTMIMIGLMAAADYFNLPGLSRTAGDHLVSLMQDCFGDIYVSLLVIDSILQHKVALDAVPEKVKNEAYHKVAFNNGCNVVDCPEGLEMISKNVIDMIIQEEDIGMRDHWQRFDLIRSWAGHGVDPFSDDIKIERKEVAMKMVEDYVNLRCIETSTLKEVVEPTGLALQHKLDDAYENQPWDPTSKSIRAMVEILKRRDD